MIIKQIYKLSPLQRTFLGIYSAFESLRDPRQAEMISTLGEVTGYVALNKMHQKMKNNTIGQELLSKKPIITNETIGFDTKLKDLDDNTLGYQYFKWMKHHEFEPDERMPIKYIDDPELAYVMLRYRQVHDFWHVLCGLQPTVLGEIVLKWFELLHTGLPVAALGAWVGPLRLNYNDRKLLREVYLPWAVKQNPINSNKPFLLNIWYEKELNTDINELRKKLSIEPVPSIS